MILKINQLSLDSISGVLFIAVLSSLIIFPQALGFSKGRVGSFTMPSIRLFQLNTMDEDDDSSAADEKKDGLSIAKQRRVRFFASLPQVKFQQKKLYFGDETDKDIVKTTIPNMLNYVVIPIVACVDTFWVGRLGDALALAGQSAAQQAFFTIYLLVSFIPNILAPSVASAISSGNVKEAQNRVKEGLFLAIFLGAIGTVLLVFFPKFSLNMMVLSRDAPAMEYAVPYLRLRALALIPALVTSTGFAAFRGLLDTVTPLKVSLAANLFNLIADPLLIFGVAGPLGAFIKGIGVRGAAIAISGSQTLSGIVFLNLLLRKKLVTLRGIFELPSWKRLRPLIVGGFTVLIRQLALNVAFLTPLSKAQSIDPSGVQAAAYGIVNQIYSIGTVCNIAMQSSAAALVPSARAKGGDDAARKIADRAFAWGTIIGTVITILQFSALPFILPLFSTLPEVQEAVKVPALISCFVQLANGPLFAGEGVMLGLECFRDLMFSTGIGVIVMYGCLSSPLGKNLNGILFSMLVFNVYRAFAMVAHYFKIGPLSLDRTTRKVN